MESKKLIKISNKQKAIIGFLGVIISIFLLSFNYLNVKKDKAFETMSYALLVNNDVTTNTKKEEIVVSTKPVEQTVTNNNAVTTSSTQTTIDYSYIGMLEIPKISLKRGFVDVDSSANNISQNVTIVKSSSYPDVENGNFILAAHSGTGRIAYFNNLYKLNIGDQVYVYYQNVKYIYSIVNIYKQQKTGKIEIYRDYNKTTLTLVTCTNHDLTTQTVYIAELVDKANY